MTTILIVDDAAVDRTIAGGFVEKTGASVLFAENAQQALDIIGRDDPDAILTDLQMPEMDGLELVKRIRRDHPGKPVILMTAYGSEEIAVKALKAGATSYVAKKNLKTDLRASLRNVLATVRSTQERKQVGRLLTRLESSFEFAYEQGCRSALLSHLQDDLVRCDFGDESDVMQIGMALTEAFTNAVDHGNLELDSNLRTDNDETYRKLANERKMRSPYQDRRVFVTEILTATDVTFTVRDEGHGFDPTTLPDPTDPENLLKPSGRGVMLIRTFMDEVAFQDSGRKIVMVKRRKSR